MPEEIELDVRPRSFSSARLRAVAGKMLPIMNNKGVMAALFVVAIGIADVWISRSSSAEELSPPDMMQFAYNEIRANRFIGVNDPAEVDIAPANLVSNWFTSRFIIALRKAAECWKHGKESIGSVWSEGQDTPQLTNLQIRKLRETQSKQIIRVEFTNYNGPDRRDFIFRKTVGGWRIDDILDQGSSCTG